MNRAAALGAVSTSNGHKSMARSFKISLRKAKQNMRFFAYAALTTAILSSTLARAESLGQINTETLKREHQISLDRKAGKIDRNQEIQELKSARDKDAAAHAEASRERRNSLGKLNQETLVREHEIAVERKEGKISRDEANKEARAARAKDAAAHAKR